MPDVLGTVIVRTEAPLPWPSVTVPARTRSTFEAPDRPIVASPMKLTLLGIVIGPVRFFRPMLLSFCNWPPLKVIAPGPSEPLVATCTAMPLEIVLPRV